MSQAGLPSAGRVGGQLATNEVGACASFSYVEAEEMAPPQASMAARSYSDIGPRSTFKLGVYHTDQAKPTAHDADQGAHHRCGGIKVDHVQSAAVDMVFYQQYNNVYGMTEVDRGAPGYYACSYGGRELARGGAGSWSLRLDPEVKRRGRLATYRAISFEGKMKSSVKKSFKWFKQKWVSWLPAYHHHPEAAGTPPSAGTNY